jgi:hypothetical protein
MKLKQYFAALLLVVSLPSAAATVELFSLGNLAVPGTAYLGNTFYSSGSYLDQYSFSINQSAAAGGLILEIDPWFNRLDLDVTSISLVGSGGLVGFDATPNVFNFGNIAAGSYTLNVASTVTRDWGLTSTPVAYAGKLTLRSGSTQVPEPGTLALFGVGLLGVAWSARRRTART